MLCGWEGNRRPGGKWWQPIPLGGWLKSSEGWLPVHLDQLRAQRVWEAFIFFILTISAQPSWMRTHSDDLIESQTAYCTHVVSDCPEVWVTPPPNSTTNINMHHARRQSRFRSISRLLEATADGRRWKAPLTPGWPGQPWSLMKRQPRDLATKSNDLTAAVEARHAVDDILPPLRISTRFIAV